MTDMNAPIAEYHYSGGFNHEMLLVILLTIAALAIAGTLYRAAKRVWFALRR